MKQAAGDRVATPPRFISPPRRTYIHSLRLTVVQMSRDRQCVVVRRLHDSLMRAAACGISNVPGQFPLVPRSACAHIYIFSLGLAHFHASDTYDGFMIDVRTF